MKLNAHYHAFEAQDIGGDYIKKLSTYAERKISSSVLFRIVLRILNPLSKKDKLKYLANYLREQAKPMEIKINEYFDFLSLKFKGQEWGINVLTVDFDYMRRGKPKRSFIKQLNAALAIKYKNDFNEKHINVFMGIDPRRPEIYKVALRYIDQIDGFKLYCYNGFFPYDPELDAIYKMAVKYNKPIIFHCSNTNINYYGGRDIKHRLKESMFDLLPNRKGNKDLSTNFCNPLGYELIAMAYPKLKIIIAHWGGNDFLNGNRFFTDEITRIITERENVYVDISYFAHDDKAKSFIATVMSIKPELSKKIIFGDDSFMTEIEGGKESVYDIVNYIGEVKFDVICENYDKYINSK